MVTRRKKTITKKSIKVELQFLCDGSIDEIRPNVFTGGVVAPNIRQKLDFNIRRELPDEENVLNPVIGEDTVKGAFQINIWGNSDGFRELGRYLLAIAELDTRNDPSFHEHHNLASGVGRTQLHIIVRKPTKNKKSAWISASSNRKELNV
jgi:hypothetical protein